MEAHRQRQSTRWSADSAALCICWFHSQSEGQLSGASTSSSASMSYLKTYLRRAPQPAVSLLKTLLHFHLSIFFGLRGELEAAEGGARCIRTCGSDLGSATSLPRAVWCLCRSTQDGEISGSALPLVKGSKSGCTRRERPISGSCADPRACRHSNQHANMLTQC